MGENIKKHAKKHKNVLNLTKYNNYKSDMLLRDKGRILYITKNATIISLYVAIQHGVRWHLREYAIYRKLV